VRHALRPRTTIIMAESELAFPFDIGRNLIQRYKHLGEDIGASEARRAQKALTDAIQAIQKATQVDSPVYTYMPDLTPPRVALPAPPPSAAPPPAPVAAAPGVGRFTFSGHAQAAAARISLPGGTGDGNEDTVRTMLKDAEAARASRDWKTAAALFGKLKEGMEQGTGNGALDPYILQQLARATYKSDGSEAGLRSAHAILEVLHPETSKDPQTLGIWGSIHRRLWEVSKDRETLDEAVQACETCFSVRNDNYTGTKYANILNVRASVTEGDDAVADRVTAKRVRQRVIAICDDRLKEPELKPAERYWAMANKAQALFGLGDVGNAKPLLAAAIAIAPAPWMVQSAQEEIQRMARVLGTTILPWATGAAAV
jgi:hypothetical protein